LTPGARDARITAAFPGEDLFVPTDEQELVAACLVGDDDARERLYSRHAGCVMAYFLRSGFHRSDADDLLQETFLRAFRSLATFDAARGGFRVWVSAIARNAARQIWARRRDADRFVPELTEELLPAEEDPAASPEAGEEKDILRKGIRALPGELRRVLELRYIEGLTTRAIATAVGMPEATVRLRLKEACDALQKKLAEAGVKE
jgi:RNA polymerase sigma-70 factor, ECF subfamily